MKVSRISLLAALAAGAAAYSTVSAAQSVRAGIEAWQRADYAAAVAIWRPLAEKGNPDAAFNLAQAYRLGRGVEVDLAAAKRWLEKAAKAGHVDAQTTLGLLLFDGGTKDAALLWLKRAAERGEPRALLVYGTALFNGDGVTRDPVLAYAYVSRAAAQGLEPARSTLLKMDRMLPLAERQRGLALAGEVAKTQPKPVADAAPEAVAAAPERQAAAATRPAVAAAAQGGWRIQLGAFSKRSSAEALYRRLSESDPVSGRQPFYVAAGAVTRLQVGPFPDRSAANAACAALSKKNQDCFVIRADER